MPCFDNSTIYCNQNSSPVTYSSYMCRSKNNYSEQNSEKLLKTINYDHLWPNSRENYATSNTFPPISKLRNILTDTISSITKQSNLQKGESVELTLEIELMGTKNNTPTNSLVEVTIIQHNKKEEAQKKGVAVDTVLQNKVPLQLETSFNSVTTQEHKSWFQRVINWSNDRDTHQDSTINHINTSSKHPGFMLNNQITENAIDNPRRNNFVRVLPEENNIAKNFKKEYRRVSPEKQSPVKYKKVELKRDYQKALPEKQSSKTPLQFQKTEHTFIAATRKNSVVRKLSNIFLPTKKAQKSINVRTDLTTLLSEVPNKAKVERNNLNNEKQKIVLAEKANNLNSAGFVEMKNNQVGLSYRSFFEPISESKCKIIEEKLSKVLTDNKKISTSRSDTCCVHLKYESSGVNVRSSSSVGNCRVKSDSKHIATPLERGDSKELSSKRKNNTGNKKQRKNLKKNAKGDAQRVSKKRSNKACKAESSRKSIIEWNGQTITVNKEIKDRIEMLIVNELQNLAIKEGMECDITALPSLSGSIDNTIEKVSSFICELDISDKKIKKLMRSKHSLETKANASQLHKPKGEKQAKKSRAKTKSKEQEYKPLHNSKTVTKFRREVEPSTITHTFNREITHSKTHISKAQNTDLTEVLPKVEMESQRSEVQITFINNNVRNWSAESTTFKLESSLINESLNTKQKGNDESENLNFGNDSEFYQKAICSGFVKKIDSNDSTWKDFLYDEEGKPASTEKLSKKPVTVTATKDTLKFSSATSNECQSSIEIELNIKDLEMIIEEAKQKQKCDTVLVTAKSKKEKKNPQQKGLTSKNSPSYTNQLLASAAEKLEKYVKRKKSRKN